MYIGNTPFQGLVGGGNILDASIEGVDLSTSAIAARLGYTPVDPGAAVFSANPTISSGTANSIAYLNGSKVVTTGSALTFDGTTLTATGTSPIKVAWVSGPSQFTTVNYDGLSVSGAQDAYYIAPSGRAQFWYLGAAELMRLSSGALSVGPSSGAGAINVGSAAGRTQYQYINFGGAQGGTDFAWQIGRSPSGGVGPADGFYIYDLKGSTTRLAINGSGNVGIGTDNPSYRLHVQQAINSNTVNTQAYFKDAGTSGGNLYQHRIVVAGRDGTGSIDIGTTDSSTLHFGNVACTFFASSGPAMYLYQASNQPILFGTNSTERMRLRADGNFGINTTDPQYKLHVNGTAYINGTFLHSALAYYPQQSISLSVGTTAWVKLFTITSPGGCRVRYNCGSNNSEEQGEFSIKGTYVAAGTQLTWNRQTYYHNVNEIRVTGSNSTPYTVWALIRTSDFGPNFNWQVIEALNSVTLHNTTGETPGTAVASLSNPGYSSTNFNHDVTVSNNVGIGTITPAEKLHVQGKMRLFDGGYPYLDLGVATNNYFRFIHDNPNDRLIIGKNGATAMVVDGSNFVHFYAQGVAGAGTINLTSADPFIRFTGSGTVDKKKWDIRAISSSGSEALEFRTINDANTVFSTKLWIAHGGNVGIGTTNPDEKLTVAGNIRIAGNQALIFQQASGPAVGAIRFTNGAGYQKAVIGSYYNIADEGGIEFVGPTSTTNMIFRSSGNLHIGATNDPGYRLGLASDTTGDGILIDVLSNPTIVLRDRGNSDTKIGTGSTAGLDNFYVSTYNVNHALMIKGSNGFVGIGTNDPGERLTVNGSIRSTTNAINFSGQVGAQFDYYNSDMRFAVHNGTYTKTMYFNAVNGALTVPGNITNSQGGGVGSTSSFYAAASIAPTSTSGGVAIYDIYLPDYFTVTDGMDLELYVHSNPNGGGSGSYRQTKHVTAHCMTTWYGSGYSPQLEWDSVNDYMGMGFDIVIYHVPTATEFATQLSSAAGAGQSYFWNSSGIRLRVKVNGFNTSYPGHQSLGLIVGYKS